MAPDWFARCLGSTRTWAAVRKLARCTNGQQYAAALARITRIIQARSGCAYQIAPIAQSEPLSQVDWCDAGPGVLAVLGHTGPCTGMFHRVIGLPSGCAFREDHRPGLGLVDRRC